MDTDSKECSKTDVLPVEEQTESLTVVDREVKLIPDVRNPEDRLQETLNESSLNENVPKMDEL